MRKSILVPAMMAMALMSAMFTSCKKDVPFSEALVGKWEVQSERQIYSISGVKKFEYVYYYVSDELAFEFTSGGNVIISQTGDFPYTTTYTIEGNKITMEMGSTDIIWDKTSIDGSTITWSETGTDIINNITYDVEIVYTAAKQ